MTVSTHALDTAAGRPAAGVPVARCHLPLLLAAWGYTSYRGS
jgi:5-hydroxyisourate hydrolase-like protein (transthyretin family)